MLFSKPRIIQHSYSFFSSRTPNPKLLTAILEGTETNPRPKIRSQAAWTRKKDSFQLQNKIAIQK